MVVGQEITLKTQGYSDIKNITDRVQEIIAESGISAGIVNISVIGSTASISTIEYEPALVQDVQNELDNGSPGRCKVCILRPGGMTTAFRISEQRLWALELPFQWFVAQHYWVPGSKLL